MKKRRAKKGQRKSVKDRSNSTQSAQPPRAPGVKFSAAQLVRKAGECVDACQQELAVQFYRRALAMEPQNTTIMDALAELLAELQLEDEAKQLLEASCQLAPNSNPAKWMYLAQVTCDGSQALVCYQSGIKLLQAEMAGLQAAQNTEELATINNQLCAAFCAVAGLYMTDLCEEEVAEAQCEQCLSEALKHDPNSPEPYQGMANLRMSQSRPEDAAQMLDGAVQRLATCVGEDGRSTMTFEFRMESSKLLIEVQKFEHASTVVQGLLQEDDENVELWYLLGYCYFHLKEYLDARQVLSTAHQMFEKLRKFHTRDKIPFPYEPQWQVVRELLAQASAEAEKIEGQEEGADEMET